MIECMDSGSFGVNLFRYAYGKILSERSDFALTASALQMPAATGHSYSYPIIGVAGNTPRDAVVGRSMQFMELRCPAQGALATVRHLLAG